LILNCSVAGLVSTPVYFYAMISQLHRRGRRFHLTTINQERIDNLESLGWDDLVSVKRKLFIYMKELTDKIINIDRVRLPPINDNIHERKDIFNTLIQRSKQIRTEIQSRNSQLLAISEKISQSKNFLSVIESRKPSEREDDLIQIIRSNQNLIEQRQYKNEQEKNEILSRIKDASMKLEAIKVISTIKEQLLQLGTQSDNISKSIRLLEEERVSLQINIKECNNKIDSLFNSKRDLSTERETYLKKYEETLSQLNTINSRLDRMSQMRKKQRQEYGQTIPNDALFKVKEAAKKKLESGSKLSFDELKLLYDENS
jgi:uncharacterized coiled-coil DUF342 family protein